MANTTERSSILSFLYPTTATSPAIPGIPESEKPSHFLFWAIDPTDCTIVVHGHGLPAVTTSVEARRLAARLEEMATHLDQIRADRERF